MGAIAGHAVVIGAGMGGLAAAGALAPWFEKVTVVERDALPTEPVQRLGAPQGRHLHALLAGGQRALASLFPGFVEEIVAAGAVPTRANLDVRFEAPGVDAWPQRDFGWVTYCVSRPLIEFVVRRLAAQAHVEFRSRCRVLGLEANAAGEAVNGVLVEYDGGRTERLAADLVIDASGRAGPTLKLLKNLGRPAPRETVIGVDFAYSTAIFEIPDDAPTDWKVLMTGPQAPASSRGGVLAPLEHGRWIMSVGGRQDETPPDDFEGLLAFIKGMRTQTLYNAIKGAKPVGEIARYGFRESVWRRFDLGPPPPVGLIPFSDSICRFNPVYGQGMSVAAQEGVLLASLLAERADRDQPLADLAAAFVAQSQPLIAAPWDMSAIPDFIFPATRGERPANLDQIFKFALAFGQLALRDFEVNKLDGEVRALLKPPSALADPAVVAKVMELMAEA